MSLSLTELFRFVGPNGNINRRNIKINCAVCFYERSGDKAVTRLLIAISHEKHKAGNH
jgi:hypothetical protein